MIFNLFLKHQRTACQDRIYVIGRQIKLLLVQQRGVALIG